MMPIGRITIAVNAIKNLKTTVCLGSLLACLSSTKGKWGPRRRRRSRAMVKSGTRFRDGDRGVDSRWTAFWVHQPRKIANSCHSPPPGVRPGARLPWSRWEGRKERTGPLAPRLAKKTNQSKKRSGSHDQSRARGHARTIACTSRVTWMVHPVDSCSQRDWSESFSICFPLFGAHRALRSHLHRSQGTSLLLNRTPSHTLALLSLLFRFQSPLASCCHHPAAGCL